MNLERIVYFNDFLVKSNDGCLGALRVDGSPLYGVSVSRYSCAVREGADEILA